MEKQLALWLIGCGLLLECFLPCILLRNLLQKTGHPLPWITLLNPFTVIGKAKDIQQGTIDKQLKARINTYIKMFNIMFFPNLAFFAFIYWAYFS